MTDAVVSIRSAVRPYLELCEAGDTVLIAVSGGADSLALAYAVLKESAPLAITAIAVTVNHQLQEGSKVQAEKVKSQLLDMGYEEVIIEDVVVSLHEGIEAGARTARYESLENILLKKGAKQIYLGHTRDDQAETVLLGLARGSGTRSLSGMAVKNKNYIRPLLSITRAETEQACKEVGVTPWNDPHNQNTDFTRVRVRKNVLPVMEENLGPGIAAALARSAALFRDDADALDEIAEDQIQALNLAELDCSYLEALPRAIRSRILRAAIYAAGAPKGAISADHLAGVEALVTAWHGQGEISLPGGVKVVRISGRLSLLAR
jgi:tRNA(Ile)-lysidine synthase